VLVLNMAANPKNLAAAAGTITKVQSKTCCHCVKHPVLRSSTTASEVRKYSRDTSLLLVLTLKTEKNCGVFNG
jgi:hypothetical protein